MTGVRSEVEENPQAESVGVPTSGSGSRSGARAGAVVSTPAGLSAVAASLYTEGPLLMRLLQRYRPFICPFELLVPLVPEGSSVLDVGCGGGLLLALLAASGRLSRGVGFDSSKPAIEAAEGMARRARERFLGVKLEFERLDVGAPWPAGEFDAVCIVDVMHHVPRGAWKSVLKLAFEKLRPGGVLVYKDMCREPAWRAWANRGHDLVLARQWIRYAPIAQIEVWCKELGLLLERRENATRWWYGHELRAFRRPGGGVVGQASGE